MNDPKSPDAAAMQSVSSTATSGLTRTDILTALGYLQSKEGAGLALMYAKYAKDAGEFKRAVKAAATEAQALAIKVVGKGKDRKAAVIAQSLARLAVLEYCRTADTPGAKCRCGGTGRIADAELIARAAKDAKPDELTRPCERCRGTGLRPVPASRVYRAIVTLAPELAEHTYYRHWRPVYDSLLAWCYTQEERAEAGYMKLTRREAA
ncbi:antitermination protein [Oceanisphaera sediminis]|uniref:Antitermination protein n=1 Tax=Oceanisphaera sediminis TaxID=981381 RepID=A0ABP7EP79_9GAMM